MKFFVPLTEDEDKAERLWESARDMLDAFGFPTEPRRIHSLFFLRGDEARILQVGVEDGDTGEDVLFIFRAADIPFYWACTAGHGLLQGAPVAVPAEMVSYETEFS